MPKLHSIMFATQVRCLPLLLLLSLPACTGSEEDWDTEEPPSELLTTDCTVNRDVFCHESGLNCSYPAKRCDPVPRALDRVDNDQLFPLHGGGHVVSDSLGNFRGLITEPQVQLNWGQRRSIEGVPKVLGFYLNTSAGRMTGWISEAAVARDLSWMPTQRPQAPSNRFDTSDWHIVPSDNRAYEHLQIINSCSDPSKGLAVHYLGRGGYVNLIYNLPGYSAPLGSGTTDLYPNNMGFTFKRSREQQSIERPLYDCSTGLPVPTGRTLRFIHGTVEGGHYGWMAMPNLVSGVSHWSQSPGAALDIGVGATGSVWVIGTNPVLGGYGIYRWNGSNWDGIDGGAVRIAVDPNGQPWIVNNAGQIFRRTGGGWQILPGAAYDIGIGSEGSVYVIGTNAVPGGYGIYRWNGWNWDGIEGGGAVRIAVDASGQPWVVNNAGNIYRRNGGWQHLPGGARDIGAGASGAVWVIGTNPVPGGFGIYRWDGAGWDTLEGGALGVSVDPAGLPWVVNNSGGIFHRR